MADIMSFCPICHRRLTWQTGVYDHNHENGHERGFLCVRCNTGLGFFKDDQIALLMAARAQRRGLAYRGEGFFPDLGSLSRAASYLLGDGVLS